MDEERAAAILEQAYAALDRADELLAQPRSVTEEDSWSTRTRDVADAATLVYKTTIQPDPAATAAPSRDWEAWVNAVIQNRLATFADLLGAEIGQQQKAMSTQLNTEIKRLQDEVASLRTEVEILRSAKNVTPIRTAHVA
jgi:hypothetical protein